VEKILATTRQELLRLKRQLLEVRAGYRLLEQKRDSLINAFMQLKGEFLEKKEKLFNELKEVIEIYDFSVKTNPTAFFDAFSNRFQSKKLIIDSKTQSIMGVRTIVFSVKSFEPPQINSKELPKSFVIALQKFSNLLPELIELASIEDALIKLALAIEKTRRRVNVLRDIVMPSLWQQIKYINLKLADQERESLVFNLKFKEKRHKSS
jgi:V/A-type H+-transporting ATPase subunit D